MPIQMKTWDSTCIRIVTCHMFRGFRELWRALLPYHHSLYSSCIKNCIQLQDGLRLSCVQDSRGASGVGSALQSAEQQSPSPVPSNSLPRNLQAPGGKGKHQSLQGNAMAIF